MYLTIILGRNKKCMVLDHRESEDIPKELLDSVLDDIEKRNFDYLPGTVLEIKVIMDDNPPKESGFDQVLYKLVPEEDVIVGSFQYKR